MWRWGPDAQRALDETAQRHLEAGALLDAFQKVFPKSNMMAYLAMMGLRLVEMRRVLKPDGSLYLHCDPTASHYLKTVLDAIFGPTRFRNEIIWKRTSAHNDPQKWGRIHDSILFYGKSDTHTWNDVPLDYDPDYLETFLDSIDKNGQRYKRTDLTGAGRTKGDSGKPWRDIDVSARNRHWAIPDSMLEKFAAKKTLSAMRTQEKLDLLDANDRIHWPKKSGGMPRLKQYREDLPGIPVQDMITDIRPLHNLASERLKYSTQKPQSLLERIISVSSKPGDIVLDPFCGCGTAVEAAEKLGRRWIGIDITYLAIDVIEKRIVKAFGPEIKNTYELIGQPQDAHDAKALAGRNWLEFQKWAVMFLGGLPKDKPGADGGIDGIIRYHRVGIEQPKRAVVSVKGGLNVGVDAVHKLKSVVKREDAELGVLVCLDEPTAAMMREVASEGEVGPPMRRVPKLQIVTVDMMFTDNDPVRLPGMLDPLETVPSTMARMKPPRLRKKRIEGQSELLLPISQARATGFAEDAKPRANRAIRPVDVEVVRPTLGKLSRR
jgi:DNA modification methylase